MTGLKILSVIISGFISCLHAGTVERIYVESNKPALKGSDIQLVCEISKWTNSDTLNLYKGDSRLPSSLAGITSLTQCFPSLCLTTSIGRYKLSADSSNVFVNITNLNRSGDQKWWTCSIFNQRKEMLLTVISVPQSLTYEDPPVQSQDLAQKGLTLKCSTGCSYPQPTFTWYYSEKGENSLLLWVSSLSISDTTTGCPDSERKYSSILSLPKYTIFPGNFQKTIKFKCSIQSLTGMSQPIFSNFSTDIQFSVRVSNVTLKDGTRILTDQLNVISGKRETLTCDTTASRPASTVVWYIGRLEKQRSISKMFSFKPQISDNNKTTYCKAFNIQSESEAVTSYKAPLFVQEQTTVKWFYIGHNKSQTVATLAEHDVNITLTCIVTGIPASKLFVIFNEDIIARKTNANRLNYNFKDITCTESGVYICYGVDDFGTSTNKTATLFVECSPRPVRQILHNVTGQLGTSVTLSFMVIAYPKPGPKGFTWFMEDRHTWITLLSNVDIRISSSELGTNLTFSNVSREHYGKYRVTTVNRIGTYDQILFFSEKDFRPDYKPDTCKSEGSEEKVPVTSIVLGIVCLLLTGYATGLTILYKRNIYRKGTNVRYRREDKIGTDNVGISTDTTGEQEYENNITENDEDSSKQYTELQHFSTDKTTYEQLRV